MKKKILSLPAIFSLGAGLLIGTTAFYLFDSDSTDPTVSAANLQEDYVDLLEENKELLEKAVQLHEENKIVRDEADKLAGLVEQYGMELNRFIEE